MLGLMTTLCASDAQHAAEVLETRSKSFESVQSRQMLRHQSPARMSADAVPFVRNKPRLKVSKVRPFCLGSHASLGPAWLQLMAQLNTGIEETRLLPPCNVKKGCLEQQTWYVVVDSRFRLQQVARRQLAKLAPHTCVSHCLVGYICY